MKNAHLLIVHAMLNSISPNTASNPVIKPTVRNARMPQTQQRIINAKKNFNKAIAMAKSKKIPNI